MSQFFTCCLSIPYLWSKRKYVFAALSLDWSTSFLLPNLEIEFQNNYLSTCYALFYIDVPVPYFYLHSFQDHNSHSLPMYIWYEWALLSCKQCKQNSVWLRNNSKFTSS